MESRESLKRKQREPSNTPSDRRVRVRSSRNGAHQSTSATNPQSSSAAPRNATMLATIPPTVESVNTAPIDKHVDFVIECLVHSEPENPIYARGIREFAAAVHSPAPSASQLKLLLDQCRLKGASEDKVDKIAENIRPDWVYELARHLAKTLLDPGNFIAIVLFMLSNSPVADAFDRVGLEGALMGFLDQPNVNGYHSQQDEDDEDDQDDEINDAEHDANDDNITVIKDEHDERRGLSSDVESVVGDDTTRVVRSNPSDAHNGSPAPNQPHETNVAVSGDTTETATLYIGNLPPGILKDVQQRLLHAEFESFSPTSMTLVLDRNYGFISFPDNETALRALQAKRETRIQGCLIRCELSRRKKSIFDSRAYVFTNTSDPDTPAHPARSISARHLMKSPPPEPASGSSPTPVSRGTT